MADFPETHIFSTRSTSKKEISKKRATRQGFEKGKLKGKLGRNEMQDRHCGRIVKCTVD